MSTDIAVTTETGIAEIDPEQAASALEHVLATGDLADFSPAQRVAYSEAGFERPTEQVDDLHIQAPTVTLRAFFEDCVQVEWQPNEGAYQVSHDISQLPPNWYNSSRMVAECNYVDDVVVGEIRRCSDVGLKGGYRVIGVACMDCGAKRWTMFSRGQRPVPLRCVSCSGKRTFPHAVAGNAKPRPWQSERQRRSGNAAWNGGRRRLAAGYIYILLELDDPLISMANRGGCVLEHRLVMARALGRPLHRWEQVHHLNGLKDDNRIDNLELWKLSQPSGVRQADYHCPGCRCGEGAP